MKTTFFAFVTLFFAINNCTNQKGNSVKFIQYETFTRGSSTVYKISPDNMTITSTGINKSENSKSVSEEEWNELLQQLQKVKISEINGLKSPTDSRASDAVLHAILSITKNNTVYKSNSFDHGNPPIQIKALVETILRLAENVE